MKDLVEREGVADFSPFLTTSFQTPEPLVDWLDFSSSTISLGDAGFGNGVVEFDPYILEEHAFDKRPAAPQDQQWERRPSFNYDQDIASATQQCIWDSHKIISGHGDFQYEIPRRYFSFTRHC